MAKSGDTEKTDEKVASKPDVSPADADAKKETKPSDASANGKKKADDDGQASKPSQPEISLKTFLQVCGLKWEQVVGFASHAERNLPGRKSMGDWKAELEKFQTTQVS